MVGKASVATNNEDLHVRKYFFFEKMTSLHA